LLRLLLRVPAVEALLPQLIVEAVLPGNVERRPAAVRLNAAAAAAVEARPSKRRLRPAVETLLPAQR
jgi:hypothetical protein